MFILAGESRWEHEPRRSQFSRYMKVLVIRFSSIGDIVLTSPVVRCLKQQLGAEVHFLTKQSFSATVKENPYIDRLITIQRSVREVRQQLKDQRYDHVIDLHANVRSMRARFYTGAHSISFEKLSLKKLLLIKLGIDWLPDVHVVDRYMETVRQLGVQNDGQGLDYFVRPEDHVDISALTGLVPGSPFVALVAGAAHYTKCMPVEQLLEICKGISLPVLVLGGRDEQVRGAYLAAHGGPHIHDLCGRLNLGQSADIVRQADLVIAHDTGLMHIAAAFKKRLITLWGSTIPRFGVWPYYGDFRVANRIVEVNGLPCRPCTKFGKSSCPRKHFHCMRQIAPATVLEEVKAIFPAAAGH